MRSSQIAALAGLTAGGTIAATMTFLDWWQNPAGLFHDEQGTRWDIVAETAMSWFWPVGMLCFVVVFASHYWLTRLRSSK